MLFNHSDFKVILYMENHKWDIDRPEARLPKWVSPQYAAALIEAGWISKATFPARHYVVTQLGWDAYREFSERFYPTPKWVLEKIRTIGVTE